MRGSRHTGSGSNAPTAGRLFTFSFMEQRRHWVHSTALAHAGGQSSFCIGVVVCFNRAPAFSGASFSAKQTPIPMDYQLRKVEELVGALRERTREAALARETAGKLFERVARLQEENAQLQEAMRSQRDWALEALLQRDRVISHLQKRLEASESPRPRSLREDFEALCDKAAAERSRASATTSQGTRAQHSPALSASQSQRKRVEPALGSLRNISKPLSTPSAPEEAEKAAHYLSQNPELVESILDSPSATQAVFGLGYVTGSANKEKALLRAAGYLAAAVKSAVQLLPHPKAALLRKTIASAHNDA